MTKPRATRVEAQTKYGLVELRMADYYAIHDQFNTRKTLF